MISDASPKERRVKRGWMNLRVAKIAHETHDTKTFYLEDAEEGGRPFDFVAGQYLTFRFDTLAEKPIVRSYTMSGSPSQLEHTIFTVKKIPGGKVSSWLVDDLKEGEILRARGPIGKFVYDTAKDAEHLVMIAGGSGVTPFISIMREYAPRLGQPGAPRSVSLLVAYRSVEDIISAKEIHDITQYPNARVVITLTRQQGSVGTDKFWHGRPDAAMLSKFLIDPLTHATFMTCGPIPMMTTVTDYLASKGVSPERVKTESFES